MVLIAAFQTAGESSLCVHFQYNEWMFLFVLFSGFDIMLILIHV